MFDAVQVQTQCFSLTRSDRVEEAYALDETTITSVAAVGHYYLIERTLLAPPRAKRIVTITSSLVNKTAGPH
ncbi:Uncharacterised protein [Serratia odorifera]|uniref:Uncharacterized protein n=1 Tax=Serratia odorifera TaxID=618 RepID=A0A3S4DEV9_SEROD|nr:Uncharacterised protein [Serratia odorifera]